MVTTIHPRHTSRRMDAEHKRIGKRYLPSAREVFDDRLNALDTQIRGLDLTVPQLRAVVVFDRFGFMAWAMTVKLAAKGIMRGKPDGEFVELTPFGIAVARRGQIATQMSIGRLVAAL